MSCAGGPPWPQLAIVVLLIAGARGPSILCVAAIAMACILATLHAKGLRQGSAQPWHRPRLCFADCMSLRCPLQVCLGRAQGLYDERSYLVILLMDMA